MAREIGPEPTGVNNGYEGIKNPLVYKISTAMLNLAIGGVIVHGIENIPDEPAVYVPSHRSMLDIPAAGCSLYRAKGEPARFMAKRELWKFPGLGRWLDAVGASPITRGKEKASMDELRPIVNAAENGENVVIFGEGTRNKGTEIAPLFGGALMIAARARRPIVPVGIGGTRPFKYHRVHTVFGEPIEATRVYELRRQKQSGLETLRQEIQAVFDKANSY